MLKYRINNLELPIYNSLSITIKL